MALRVFSFHANTAIEGDREVSRDAVARRLKYVGGCLAERADRAVFLYAMGAQRRMDLDRAYGVDGIEVVWSKSLIPALLAPLRLVVASYAGLLRVTDLTKIEQAFATIVDKSMAALYSVSHGFEDEFVSRTKVEGAPRYHDFGIKQDPAYFIYMVDADSMESSTGLYEIVSMGREASECLQQAFADYLASPPTTEPPAAPV